MNKGKLLLGVLVGFAAGTFVGILYAPDKGYKTRRRIAKKGMDYADDLTEKLDDYMDEVTDKFKSAVKKVKESVIKEQVNVNNRN